MATKQKYITSHSFRVKRAKQEVENSAEKISRFDMEALVETYLLDDVCRLYTSRLEKVRMLQPSTRSGEMSKKSNMEKFAIIINLFRSAYEIAQNHIISGNYKAVWSSIPEYVLMMVASKVNQLPKLREIAVKLLRSLYEEGLLAAGVDGEFIENLNEIEDHDANARRLKGLPPLDEVNTTIKKAGLPSVAEFNELIKAAEVAIPDAKNHINLT